MWSPGFRTLLPRPYLTTVAVELEPSTASSLPRYRTSFVGRDAELAEVARLLADPATRFVTIVGRSGVGKTRLAVEAGNDSSAAARGVAVLVDLGNAHDAGDVATLLADALETGHVAGQSAEDAIRRRLRIEPAVVIADDVDRVRGSDAAVLDLLSESPGSVVIATAQRATGIAGELVIRLDGLGLPKTGVRDRGQLLANAAVVLYADRAAAVDPGFRLTSSNVEDVAELAQRLDGLPLAIELGAARAHILSPHAQLAALDEHSPLELRSRRGAEGNDRHRDVRSVVAVSYAAASEPARLVLRRMSIAADAVTSERVRDLVTEPGWTLAGVLDALAELVDLGLADVDRRSDGEPRFRLHPTVAAYGRERLAAEDDESAVQRRYVDAVVAVGRATRTMPHRRRLGALADASAELHAVFARLADESNVEGALELAADLSPLWLQRGLFQGSGSTFQRLLTAGEGGAARVDPATLACAQLWWTRVVIHDASLSRHREAVVARLARGVETARESGDDALLLFALDCVVWAVFVTGDMKTTAAAVAEGLPLAERLGDRAEARRYAYCTAMLANMAGDTATALRFAAPALEGALHDRDLLDTIRVCSVLWTVPPGTPGLPRSIPSAEALLHACLDAGEVAEASLLYATLTGQALVAGSVVEAARWAIRGLDLAQQLGAWYSAGLTTAALILVANRRGDHAIAAGLYGVLTPVLPEVMVGLGPYMPRYQAAIATSREAMGSTAFDQVVADSAIVDRDVAIDRAAAYAQSLLAAAGEPVVHAVPAIDRPRRPTLTIPQPETPGRPEHLTPRELDVLRALMTGATNGAIGASLGLRPKTVMHHSVSIYAKLGVRGRTEATAWAYRNGLATDPALEDRVEAATT
jgi:predicted ATPase/DNA-binding CsgD family transcriptional regulator